MARVVYSQEELLAHKPPNVPFLVFFTLIWPLFTPLCACCTTERLAGMYSCLFFRFTHIIQRHLRLKWIHHAQCTYFPAESRSADLFVQWVREAAPDCPAASTGTSVPPAAHFLVRTANFGLNILANPSIFIHTLLPAFEWKNMTNLMSCTLRIYSPLPRSSSMISSFCRLWRPARLITSINPGPLAASIPM